MKLLFLGAAGTVVLSYAHLDHVGFLPALGRKGFAGPIYCTRATAALTPIMLRDAAHLDRVVFRRAGHILGAASRSRGTARR